MKMTKRRKKQEEEEEEEKKKKNFSVNPFKDVPTKHVRFLWQFHKHLKRVSLYLFHQKAIYLDF